MYRMLKSLRRSCTEVIEALWFHCNDFDIRNIHLTSATLETQNRKSLQLRMPDGDEAALDAAQSDHRPLTVSHSGENGDSETWPQHGSAETDGQAAARDAHDTCTLGDAPCTLSVPTSDIAVRQGE